MTATPPAFTAEDYRNVFRNQASSVAIVTLSGDDRPYGFTATSVVSVSADPAVIMFSIMSSSSSWPAMSRAESVVLHFLGHGEVALAQRFATSGIDRFADVEWSTLPTGEPVLTNCGTWVRATVLGHQEVGGSHMFQVRPTHSEIANDRSPLVYHGRAYHYLSDLTQIQP